MLAYVILGALALECVRLVRNRQTMIAELLSAHFWVSLVLSAVIGFAAMFIVEVTTTKEAVMLGIVAPTIIEKVASRPPPGFTQNAGRQTPFLDRLRAWWW